MLQEKQYPLKKLEYLGADDLNLNKNTKNYRDNHKHRYAMEIILHFINVKY